MAQSGFTAIQLYSSPTPGASPAASNLTSGELAINAADGKLFYKDTAGNTQVIANSAYSSFSAFSSGVALQGSGTSVVATGTIQFANSNGVSFGLNGSTMTASVAADANSFNIISAGGNTAGALTTFAASTVVLAGGNNITLSQNSNTISINAGGAVTFSAGSTSTATNNLVFTSGGDVSFQLNGNSISGNVVARSCIPLNQLGAYGGDVQSGFVYLASAPTDSKNAASSVFYPLVLDHTLVFQNIRQMLNLATANGQMTINLTASTASTNYAYTHSFGVDHAIYSKTGDTFSSLTNVPYIIGFTGNMNVSRSNVGTAASHTISLYFSQEYGYGTGPTGPLKTTITTSALSQQLLYNSTITSTQINVQSTAFTASNISGLRAISAVAPAPITLNPNTYWVLHGLSSSSTAQATAVNLNVDNYGQILDMRNNGVALRRYLINTTAFISKNESLANSPMGGSAPSLSDFGMLYLYLAGTNWVNTGYALAESSAYGPPVSVLSTALGQTSANSGAGLSVYVPQVTYL